MNRQTHELKIDKQYLDAKLDGDKLFEIRYNDRGYQKGDYTVYKEIQWNPAKILYHKYEITYVTAFNQKDGWVVFGERYIGTDQ